ncbi:hypothetical protein AB0F81_15160 [Actinoplanes sp. NPDC024001]|uniref:hypothetical protein n=1 Tax=Actinoplanes sp. NPDC024001 TaxID=3154598 RepID=UPI0033E28C4F
MTNWMTAAGLAFIAGGLATLISFRAMLFGGGARRATRAGAPARRRRSRTAVAEPVQPAESRVGRRRRLAAAFSGQPTDTDPGTSGLASIGLADEDPEPAEEREVAEEHEEHEHYEEHEEYEEAPEPVVDRIEGWVRPSYRDLDDRPPAGDYWTPVPDDLYADPEPSARGYGWPVPVERLPPVPSYEPATGFDLTPVQAAEPTTLVPTWPPDDQERRIRLPRSWATRDEKDRPRPRPRPDRRAEPYVSRHSAGPHG